MSDDRVERITRREALARMAAAGAGLALGWRFAPQALADGSAPREKTPSGRAKAVIQVWMWGGPSHIDTFDPKPDAGYDYCGALDKAVATNVPGIRIGASLPLLAKQADKYALIRSMTHGNNGHETASYMVQTGHVAGEDRLVYPSAGAVVALFRGYGHGYAKKISPFVVLTESPGRFSEVGCLDARLKPLVTGGDPNQKRFAVDGIVAEGISDDRQRARRSLLHDLDSLGKAMPGNPEFARFDRCEEEAYDLILGGGGKVFDLSQEKDETRDRYGRNKFGQSCLAARRLVEYGVPYVTINYPGWDTHKQHFETMSRKLPELDRGLATLIEDLAGRGLLESTIVWCCGEFGRTPRVQWEAPWNGGRGHHGACFSALVAGGGFKGGRVVGETDALALEVVRQPVYPRDLLAGMYGLLGISPDARLPNPRSLEVPVLPRPADGTPTTSPLAEIL